MPVPSYVTLATEGLSRLDYGDVLLATKPAGTSDDPREWAEALFSIHTMPRWVAAALGLRQLLAPLIGVPRAPADTFGVSRVVGDEALISVDDRHLDFRCGIGVSATDSLVRVTTTVKLHGWRGRLYFLPVRILHPIVVASMLKRCTRVMARRAEFA